MSFTQYFKKIKRIISWLPVLWNDYEFDNSYLFRILHKKLEMMEAHMKSDNCCVKNTKSEIRKITIAKNLAKRIAEEGYDRPMFLDSIDYCDYNRKRDLELLCKILNRNSLSWWD